MFCLMERLTCLLRFTCYTCINRATLLEDCLPDLEIHVPSTIAAPCYDRSCITSTSAMSRPFASKASWHAAVVQIPQTSVVSQMKLPYFPYVGQHNHPTHNHAQASCPQLSPSFVFQVPDLLVE